MRLCKGGPCNGDEFFVMNIHSAMNCKKSPFVWASSPNLDTGADYHICVGDSGKYYSRDEEIPFGCSNAFSVLSQQDAPHFEFADAAL